MADDVVTVGIVDNDPYALLGLTANVRAAGAPLKVAWTSALGAAGFQKALDPGSKPDVLLVDMSLNDMSGVDLCAQIRLRSRDIGLVGISSFPLERYRAALAQAGAQGLIGKRSSAAVLGKALLAAARGDACPPLDGLEIDSGMDGGADGGVTFDSVADAFARVNLGRQRGALSPHEREAISWYAQGLKTAEVAERMGITVSSVQTLANRARAKLGAASLAQAVALSVERELLLDADSLRHGVKGGR